MTIQQVYPRERARASKVNEIIGVVNGLQGSLPNSSRSEVTISLSSQTITTTRTALSGTLSVAAVDYPRLAIVTAASLLSHSVTIDFYVSGIGPSAVVTIRKRARFVAAESSGSKVLTIIEVIPVGETRDYIAEVATSTGSTTAATAGGGDLNCIQAAFVGLPPT